MDQPTHTEVVVPITHIRPSSVHRPRRAGSRIPAPSAGRNLPVPCAGRNLPGPGARKRVSTPTAGNRHPDLVS